MELDGAIFDSAVGSHNQKLLRGRISVDGKPPAGKIGRHQRQRRGGG